MGLPLRSSVVAVSIPPFLVFWPLLGRGAVKESGASPDPPEFNHLEARLCAYRNNGSSGRRSKRIDTGEGVEVSRGYRCALKSVNGSRPDRKTSVVRLVANGCRKGARRADHEPRPPGRGSIAKRGPEADGNRRHDPLPQRCSTRFFLSTLSSGRNHRKESHRR